MMFLLAGDVIGDGATIGGTYGEYAVSVLPGSGGLAYLVMHPAGRDGFHVANDVGEAMCGFEAQEQVDVIAGAAYGLGDSIDVLDDAA